MRHLYPLCLLAALLLSNSSATADKPPRPNVILMMADDLGWGDVQCFNAESPIKTPNLDAMAAGGMKFNRFYAAAPVCSPTRGSCLTGRHPFRYGIYNANAGHMREAELTLAELLKEHGYATGHFGKWHLGTLTKTVRDSNRGGKTGATHYAPPTAHGFDVYFSTEAKVPTYDPMWKPAEDAKKIGWDYLEDLDSAVAYNTRYWNTAGEPATENLRGDDSRVIMDRVVPFVEQAKRDGQPFFAVVWFHAPHLPVVAGPKHAAMYAEYDTHARNYYGCITALDEQVGRLRAKLRSLEVAENTMVWFCSDNGPEGTAGNMPGSAAHLRGRKRSLHEGGIRVPGILEWPSTVKPGSQTDFPAVTSDYLPTIVDALGAKFSDERPRDGISLLSLLAGEQNERKSPIGFQSAKQCALIADRFKLHSKDRGATWQLFDLQADPSEATDVAAKFPVVVEKMAQTFDEWRNSCAQSDEGADYR